MARHKKSKRRVSRRGSKRKGSKRGKRKALVIRCKGSRISARRMRV